MTSQQTSWYYLRSCCIVLEEMLRSLRERGKEGISPEQLRGIYRRIKGHLRLTAQAYRDLRKNTGIDLIEVTDDLSAACFVLLATQNRRFKNAKQKAENELAGLKVSLSYRLGVRLTAPVRALRQFLRKRAKN
jgi:hypothetical protein